MDKQENHESTPPVDPPRFTDYQFRDSLLWDIKEAGFEEPLPIQEACIPPALEGKDLIGLAQTGTGKTAAFVLPIIHRIAHRVETTALVLAPTRELAQQIAGVFDQLGETSGIRTAVIVGGIRVEHDYKSLQMWPNVIVATPGRLIDHINCRTVILDDIETLVIDEADRMHDMGFIPQIRRIMSALPKKRQTMLFTATMSREIERIAGKHMTNPIRKQIGRRSAPAERAEQLLFRVPEEMKTPLLLYLLGNNGTGRVLVFVRTKRGVDRLARAVKTKHRSVTRLHSDRGQAERNEAMDGFKEGKYRILIATDIAARGIDVENIEHVINYDFPHHAEDYVHRIGRTARVAAAGQATSFVTRSDRRFVENVEKLVGLKLTLTQPPGVAGKSKPSRIRRKRSRRNRK